MPRADTVDAYLAALPQDRRATLAEVRKAIRAAAPTAKEVIAYNMPAFRLGDRILVSYDVYKVHTSLFPASKAVRDVLGAKILPYLSGKCRIRFPASRPIPVSLVAWVVQVRLTELSAQSG